MSRVALIVGIALLGFAVRPEAAHSQDRTGEAQTPGATAGPQTIEMTVLGLSCPFCAYGLERKLRKLEGLAALEIDFKSGRVEMDVKDGSKASDERIKKLVKDAGFEVEGEIRRSPLSKAGDEGPDGI